MPCHTRQSTRQRGRQAVRQALGLRQWQMPAAGFSYSTAASHKIIMQIRAAKGERGGACGEKKGESWRGVCGKEYAHQTHKPLICKCTTGLIHKKRAQKFFHLKSGDQGRRQVLQKGSRGELGSGKRSTMKREGERVLFPRPCAQLVRLMSSQKCRRTRTEGKPLRCCILCGSRSERMGEKICIKGKQMQRGQGFIKKLQL